MMHPDHHHLIMSLIKYGSLSLAFLFGIRLVSHTLRFLWWGVAILTPKSARRTCGRAALWPLIFVQPFARLKNRHSESAPPIVLGCTVAISKCGASADAR